MFSPRFDSFFGAAELLLSEHDGMRKIKRLTESINHEFHKIFRNLLRASSSLLFLYFSTLRGMQRKVFLRKIVAFADDEPRKKR